MCSVICPSLPVRISSPLLKKKIYIYIYFTWSLKKKFWLLACRYKQTSCSRTNVSDHAIAPTDSQLLLEVSTYSSRSIERTSLEILGYMNDVTARRIGFHGSDEIGRTSVLEALISNPKIKDLFDVVIWVTVARNWSTRKVQDEVLRQLPLSSEDFNTDFEIVVKLLQVLRSQI